MNLISTTADIAALNTLAAPARRKPGRPRKALVTATPMPSMPSATAPGPIIVKPPLFLGTDMLTAAQVCKLLAMSRPTLYRWVAEKRFPSPIKMGSRMARWTPSAIESWLALRANDNAPTAQAA
jgi:excisionase family DNA binding protein